jgi:ribonuclease Z
MNKSRYHYDKHKDKKYLVEIIDCHHKVPTNGYLFSESKKKIKKEYSSLTTEEIKKLKFEGVQIDEVTIKRLFVFLGDTNYLVLEKNEQIFEYPYIFVECSFFIEEHIELADEKMHIHWCYLKDYVEKYTNVTFILYHFSLRYKNIEIKEFFEKLNYKNVMIWLDDEYNVNLE